MNDQKEGFKVCAKCKGKKPADLEHYYKDARSSNGLSSWCIKCQTKDTTPDNQAAIKREDYMEDGQGRLVHIDNVKEIDKVREGLVVALVSKARAIQGVLADFKQMAMKEIEAFVDLSAMEYDVKLGGKKGNLTLYSYDMKYKIQIQISEYLVFDERLQVAKSMIDECFNKWTENSRSEIKTIINDAFQVDKEGRINTKRILSLRKFKIDDELWQKAMNAITDSLQVAGSKSYMRIYERAGAGEQWKHITLDMAAL